MEMHYGKYKFPMEIEDENDESVVVAMWTMR